MKLLLLYCLNVLYFPSVILLSLAFELFFPFFGAAFLLLRRGRFDDVARIHNWAFGALFVLMFRPLIRVSRNGLGNLPDWAPIMIVVNHRSIADVFLCTLVSKANTAMLVRSWPFRIPFFGWFMRAAGYVDVEGSSFDTFKEHVNHLASRGISWICFPEGHRSRTGRLQRFRLGAFALATESKMLVLPVCMTGTERFCPPGSRLFKPAHIHIEILPPVDPEYFPAEDRASLLCRHVKSRFKEYLGE